jgi:hypothetical protein
MRSDKQRIMLAFCIWLESEGWTSIRRQVEFVDIVDERDSQTPHVEARGRTFSPGSTWTSSTDS